MDTFIDTCIIFSSFDNKDEYYEIVNIFLDGLKGVVISVYQEKEEIPKFFLRKEKLFSEALKFLKNKGYNVDYSNFTDQEKIILKQLLTKINLNQENEISLKQKFREIILFRRNVNSFIQKKVLRSVIPISEISGPLVEIIKNFNRNSADAKVIASAIQEHQTNNLIAFTLDKKDWKLNSLREKIENLGYECPEVRFLR